MASPVAASAVDSRAVIIARRHRSSPRTGRSPRRLKGSTTFQAAPQRAATGGHRGCPPRARPLRATRSDEIAAELGQSAGVDSMTEEEKYEEACDAVARLASTINAYDYVALTSKSTNMGTYVYNELSKIPEQYRGLLIEELSDRGITNCWFIAGMLYKVKLLEREATGPMDISNDLEEYQERLERVVSGGEKRDETDEEEDENEDGEPSGEVEASVFGGLTDGADIRGKSVKDRAEERSEAAAKLKVKKEQWVGPEDDDDYVDTEARRRSEDAAAAGVQVFGGRAANVPGGPFINRFQKVFYPAPNDIGTWYGRVVVKKPRFIEKYIPLYFKTNDTLERFLKVPATAEDADLMLDYQNPPYLEADMPPGMEYPSRKTAGEGKLGTWWPIPKLPLPPFDTLVDYLRPLGPGVYAGKGWRGGGSGDEFLTFILIRRYDVTDDV